MTDSLLLIIWKTINLIYHARGIWQ